MQTRLCARRGCSRLLALLCLPCLLELSCLPCLSCSLVKRPPALQGDWLGAKPETSRHGHGVGTAHAACLGAAGLSWSHEDQATLVPPMRCGTQSSASALIEVDVKRCLQCGQLSAVDVKVVGKLLEMRPTRALASASTHRSTTPTASNRLRESFLGRQAALLASVDRVRAKTTHGA